MKTLKKPSLLTEKLTLNAWATGTGVSRRSLHRALQQAGLGEQTTWSFQEILRALLRQPELAEARLRKLRAEGLMAEHELAVARREVVPAAAVYSFFEPRFVAMKNIILRSQLDDGSKDDLLRELRERPAAEVAKGCTEGGSISENNAATPLT